MQQIKHFLSQEYKYFLKLPFSGRMLLISYTLYSMTEPLFNLITTAYVLRRTNGDPLFIAVYYGGIYLALPLGFYINGLALKYIRINALYRYGCLLEGIIIVTFIFLPAFNLTIIGILGFIQGIGAGLFWANRNFLTLKATSSGTRIYFNSLETSLSGIINIVMPIVLGWFIVTGEKIHLYSINTAYIIIAFLALFTLTLTGWVLRTTHFHNPEIGTFFLRKPNNVWNGFRIYALLNGFASGMLLFLPSTLILVFVGKENTLGTIQTAAGIFSAFIIYLVGKKVTQKHRFLIQATNGLAILTGALIFALFPSATSVLAYFVGYTISIPFSWVGFFSLSMDSMEHTSGGPSAGDYTYIFDQEIMLNTGRVIAICLFFYGSTIFSQHTALRFTPLMLACVQCMLVPLSYMIDQKRLKKIIDN